MDPPESWIIVSDLSVAVVGSFISILFVVPTIGIAILLMYNCGHKFARRHKPTKRLLHNNTETSNPSKTSPLNGEAEGPVQDGDAKKRRTRCKKSKNRKPEEEDKGARASHELAKNTNSQCEISSKDKETKDLGKGKPRNVENEVKAEELIRMLRNAVERSGTKRREKYRCDVSDSVGSREQPKLDSTMKIRLQHPRCSQSRSRTISDDHVGSRRGDTASDDVDHGCQKDSVSALRGNKASDSKSKQKAMALRHLSKNIRCPGNQRTSSELDSSEHRVKTTDESRNTSSAMKVVNKKVHGSAVMGDSAGHQTARVDTGKDESVETEKHRLDESLKSCSSEKENEPITNGTNRISSKEDCHRLRCSSSNQLRPCSLKIEVGGLQTQSMEDDKQCTVPNQEDSRSPRHPPNRTWSADSGYAEEIVSPTWESSDDGVVPLASTEGMYHSEITRTFDNKKTLSANDNAKETERNKRNAWSSESIQNKLQGQSPSNDITVTDSHVLIDPEVRERIAKPKRPVRMPDKPFEHLSYMEMDRKRRSPGQNTNISFVEGNDGIFGRCWTKKVSQKVEEDVSSEDEDDDDSFWDLRDNVCPTFMIWGVCRLGDRCSQRHPSGRYLKTSTKTSVRLPLEETRRDPASFAAVLDRTKDEPPEVFYNDVPAPLNDKTVREKAPSYSLALTSGKIKKQDGKVTTDSGEKQSYEEAWPALGSSSPRNGTAKHLGSRDLNHADQKGLSHKELKKENFVKSWANSSHPVFDKSTVDKSLEEGSGQWQGSEYQEEDWYEIDGWCETDDNQESIVSGKDSYSDSRYKTKVGLLESKPALDQSNDNSTKPCVTNEKTTPAQTVIFNLCDICTDRPKDATLVCGHRFCYTCALQMRLDERVCAICRRCIVSVIKTYN